MKLIERAILKEIEIIFYKNLMNFNNEVLEKYKIKGFVKFEIELEEPGFKQGDMKGFLVIG